MKRVPTVSIVLPAYNEEKVIKKTLDQVLSYLSRKKYSYEIVVSDDGSRDKTSEIVKKFVKKKVRLIKLAENKGKGGALREGILNAKGKYIVFMDADLSVPLENIDIFLRHLQKGSDVVIASRRIKGAKILVHQPWHRETMGRVFTYLTKVLTGTNIADFTCGFKGFSNKAAMKIFKASLIDRWAYDAEILFLAKKFGYKVKQIPVSWKNRQDTRVRLKSVVLETFRDLINVRIYDFLGKYDTK